MDELSSQTGKRRVAIYVRVSTSEQKLDGYGLEAQESQLLAYVENNKGLNLQSKKEWIFRDIHTGSDIDRPALQKLLRMIEAGKFDAVLIWKLDRLSRSLKHLLTIFETFQKKHVSLISLQENIDFNGPIGRFMSHIFGAVAEFERELIKGRTKMGKIASAEMGNYTGPNIPYGYKPVPNPHGKGKKLALIPEEKKWVEQIFYWYIYDDMGDAKIAARLNELKVPKGKHLSKEKNKYSSWTAKQIQKIIQDSIYRGEFVANRTDENGKLLPEDKWTIVTIPACISELTFQQAQHVRNTRTGGNKKLEYLLSGKVKDASVSPTRSFVGKPRTRGGLSYARKQFQRDGMHYPIFEIPAKPLDEYVWGKVLNAMKNPEQFIQHYFSNHVADSARVDKLEQTLNHLREQKVNLQLVMGRIERAFESGIYSEDEFHRKRTKRNAEMSELEVKIQEVEDDLSWVSSVDIEAKKLREVSEQVKFRLENLDQKQKKLLCSLFVDRVEMNRRKEGNRWKIDAEVYFRFNPERFVTPSSSSETHGGRTEKVEYSKDNHSLDGGKGLGGQTRCNSYTKKFLFHFSVTLFRQ